MSHKGNILLVANWESGVGYAWWLMENFWTAIADSFNKKGTQSYLAYPKITVIPESVSNSSIKPIELDFRKRSFATLTDLYRTIKKYNIKHIYLTDSPTYSILYILLRYWGIKSIIVHDHTPGERDVPGAAKKILKSIIQRLPYITVDHVIGATEFVRKRLIEVSCIPENKCSCAPNGIKPIDLKHCDKHYAQRIFNIPSSRTVIVTTGRATYYKGIDFFIECAHELINNHSISQLHFLYCGNGPDMEEFKSLVNKYKLTDNFTFAGTRTDIRKILPSCQIGFHAATGEVGYSLSILEYMSAGLVTIVPQSPSTSLATTDMKNGLLYKYRDLNSATNTIRRVLNREIPLDLGHNATTLVKELYSIENTNKKLIKIMEKFIK